MQHMKTWKKWTLGIALTLIIAITVLYLIKQKQIREFRANFVPAQHETKQSMLDYAALSGIPGDILVAKDTVGYENIFDLFAPGNIIVLDANNNIVDCNFSDYHGSCYADIADYICNDFDFTKSKYDHKITDSTLVNRLKSSTVSLATDSAWNETAKNDYTVIFCWAKWMKISHTNEGKVQKIGECIKNNTKYKIALVSVNTDCVAPWYPVTAELPN
jgi:hypothetical protein